MWHHHHAGVGGGVAMFVDEGAGLHLQALVVRHAHLALRHAAGGEIEHKGFALCRARAQWNADATRVGAKTPIGAAPGRHHRARQHVDKMHSHQAFGHGHLGKVADAAEVVGVAQSHDAAALLLRAGNAQAHGLFTHNLPVTALAIKREQAADVEVDFDARVGFQAAFQHRVDVTRQHAHAMGVMATQIRHDEVVGNRLRFFFRAASRCKNRSCLRTQFRGLKEFVHKFLIFSAIAPG